MTNGKTKALTKQAAIELLSVALEDIAKEVKYCRIGLGANIFMFMYFLTRSFFDVISDTPNTWFTWIYVVATIFHCAIVVALNNIINANTEQKQEIEEILRKIEESPEEVVGYTKEV